MKETDRKVLFVANVAKEHVVKFHLPTIRKFKKEGWQVDVACFHDADVPCCDHQYDVSWKRSPFSFGTIKGIFEIKKILKETHYDLVYCHTPVGGLVARLGANKARKEGTKVIYMTHGLHFYKDSSKINWYIYYPVEKLLSRCCDAIFTVNDEDYQLVRVKFTKPEVRLVPGIGVNFDRLKDDNPKVTRKLFRQKHNIPEDAFVMIYVAELTANKNQKMLLKTLKLLRERGENVFLILAGPDHYRGHLQETVSKMKIAEYVRILGWSEEIGKLLRAADVCTASSIREGFGINLIEAIYCGLPVIATNNRGHLMALKNGKNGLLVKINDYEKMAGYIEKMIKDKAFKESYSHFDVNEYEANLIANKIYLYIEEILGD